MAGVAKLEAVVDWLHVEAVGVDAADTGQRAGHAGRGDRARFRRVRVVAVCALGVARHAQRILAGLM